MLHLKCCRSTLRDGGQSGCHTVVTFSDYLLSALRSAARLIWLTV